MAFERIAEARIREAQKEGKFDRLPGSGSPLDFEEYFKLPVELRLAYSVLKSANCLPEEVTLLNDIAALERELEATTERDARHAVRKKIDHLRLRLSLALEAARRR
jgi:DnaJ homologue, subfamily C, member 28, conserved domain